MKPPFRIEWVEVNPELAKTWLAKNPPDKNRNLRDSTVEAYARDMVGGRWAPNHQAIAFKTNGDLMDGQHRLSALVLAGVTLPFLVCFGVPEKIEGVKADVMDTIDRGNPRSVADVLRLSHGYKAHAPTITASCTIMAALALKDVTGRRIRRPSVPAIVAIAQRYRKALEFVCSNRPSTRGLRNAQVAGAIAFAYNVAPAPATAFYNNLKFGVGLGKESPALTLRNYLLGENSKIFVRGSMRDRYELAELALHALWCEIHHKPMPRAPHPSSRSGADWFRSSQAANLTFINNLFPSVRPEQVPVLTPAAEQHLVVKDVKLTPLAEQLIRDKDMHDRLHNLGPARVAAMQKRIERGELKSAIK